MASLASYFPFLETITTYKKEYFKFDLVAGLTVAVVALPQSMAYAMIAGVDPVYGLYSAIVLSILGSLFGSSNHLATGPTNAISLLIASYMSYYLSKPNFLEILFLLTFMVGAIQFLMGVLKLGKLVNYVSHSVIIGFTAGAGVIIALGQLNQLLGITLPKGKMSTLGKVTMTIQNIDQLNYYALGLGLFTVAVILIAKKISRNIPGALMGIFFSVALVMTLGLANYGIKLTGEIPSAIPPFKMVLFDLGAMSELAGGAFVIAIIGLVEAISISKAISSQTMQRIDPNQEFIGQGVANMGGALFASIAGSGSFTRSAITYQSKGVTRLAGVLAGLIVALVLLALSPYARYIPNASLAGVIMVVAYSMVDKNAVRRVFKSNRNDAIVMSITFLTTIFAHELEYAIYAGIIVAIVLYLRDTGAATVSRLVPSIDKEGKFIEYKLDSTPIHHINKDVSIVQLEGNLYFGLCADLEEKLNSAYPDSRVVILRFKGVSLVDVTALEVIEHFVTRAVKEKKKIVLCDIKPRVADLMRRTHIFTLVGQENIFLSEEELLASSFKALDKANSWLQEEPSQTSDSVPLAGQKPLQAN